MAIVYTLFNLSATRRVEIPSRFFSVRVALGKGKERNGEGRKLRGDLSGVKLGASSFWTCELILLVHVLVFHTAYAQCHGVGVG